jgi:hypothetical protein
MHPVSGRFSRGTAGALKSIKGYYATDRTQVSVTDMTGRLDGHLEWRLV